MGDSKSSDFIFAGKDPVSYANHEKQNKSISRFKGDRPNFDPDIYSPSVQDAITKGVMAAYEQIAKNVTLARIRADPERMLPDPFKKRYYEYVEEECQSDTQYISITINPPPDVMYPMWDTQEHKWLKDCGPLTRDYIAYRLEKWCWLSEVIIAEEQTDNIKRPNHFHLLVKKVKVRFHSEIAAQIRVAFKINNLRSVKVDSIFDKEGWIKYITKQDLPVKMVKNNNIIQTQKSKKK